MQAVTSDPEYMHRRASDGLSCKKAEAAELNVLVLQELQDSLLFLMQIRKNEMKRCLLFRYLCHVAFFLKHTRTKLKGTHEKTITQAAPSTKPCTSQKWAWKGDSGWLRTRCLSVWDLKRKAGCLVQKKSCLDCVHATCVFQSTVIHSVPQLLGEALQTAGFAYLCKQGVGCICE